MAVQLEERYKSIRSPHKIKGGVSGCVRECAEAQSKDFGLIATDKGWNCELPYFYHIPIFMNSLQCSWLVTVELILVTLFYLRRMCRHPVWSGSLIGTSCTTSVLRISCNVQRDGSRATKVALRRERSLMLLLRPELTISYRG